ncbi:MAG: MFS transporter [Armatimonadota bacterium]|nr:MFS transporter [Armatimonadota bacterium]
MTLENGKGGAPTTPLTPSAPPESLGGRLYQSFYDNFLRVLIDYPFLIALGAIALLAELGYAILNIATLPLHLDVDLHEASWTGLVLASFLTVEAVFKSPFGALGDRIGRKPLMVVGPLFSSACCFVMYYLTQAWQFMIVHGFNGLGFAAFWPSCFSTIADRVRKEDLTKAMSVFNLTYMLGIALGPLAKTLTGNQDVKMDVIRRLTRERILEAAGKPLPPMGPGSHFGRALHQAARAVGHAVDESAIRFQVMRHVSHMSTYELRDTAGRLHLVNHHHFPFLLVGCIFLLTSLMAVVLIPNRKPGGSPDAPRTDQAGVAPIADGAGITAAAEEEEAVVNPHAASSLSLLQQITVGMKTIPWMMVIAFTIFMGIGFLTPCMEPYILKVYRITEKQFSFGLLPIALFIGVLALPMGRLGDKWGSARSVRLGMIICAAGLWLCAFHPLILNIPGVPKILGSFGPMSVLVAIVGAGFVIASPAWMARVTEMAPNNLRGAVLGAASMAQGVGALVGTVVGGYLWAHYKDSFPEAPMFAAATLLTIGTLLALWQVPNITLPHED